jgi:hypothetical protein
VSDLRFYMAAAAVVVALVVACFAAYSWREDQCQRAGGRLQMIASRPLCLTPDGRVIGP